MRPRSLCLSWAGEKQAPGLGPAGCCLSVNSNSQAQSPVPLLMSDGRDMLDAFESMDLKGRISFWGAGKAVVPRIQGESQESLEKRRTPEPGWKTAQGCGLAAPPGGDKENGFRDFQRMSPPYSLLPNMDALGSPLLF